MSLPATLKQITLSVILSSFLLSCGPGLFRERSFKSNLFLAALLTILRRSPIPDTGQTLCFNDTASPLASCGEPVFPGQDGDYVDVPAARSFTGPTNPSGNNNFMTYDNVTGLTWMSCHGGYNSVSAVTWGTGQDCSGSYNGALVSGVAFANAASICSTVNGQNYGGKNDWRLPSIRELETVLDFGIDNVAGTIAAINTTYFPAPSSGNYWSADENLFSGGANYWTTDTATSTVSSQAIGSTLYVRCVSGTPMAGPLFRDNGDETVTDATTKLVWQKCSMGLSGTGCASGAADQTNWQTALNNCNSLSLDNRKWRLPSVNELLTLADYSIFSPAININVFPNTQASAGTDYYWTSTTTNDSGSYAQAFTVEFQTGAQSLDAKTNSATRFTRCVSGP